MGKIKVTNGKETYEIDEQDFSNAAADGFRRVDNVKKVTVSNGKEVFLIDDADLQNALKDGYKPVNGTSKKKEVAMSAEGGVEVGERSQGGTKNTSPSNYTSQLRLSQIAGKIQNLTATADDILELRTKAPEIYNEVAKKMVPGYKPESQQFAAPFAQDPVSRVVFEKRRKAGLIANAEIGMATVGDLTELANDKETQPYVRQYIKKYADPDKLNPEGEFFLTSGPQWESAVNNAKKRNRPEAVNVSNRQHEFLKSDMQQRLSQTSLVNYTPFLEDAPATSGEKIVENIGQIDLSDNKQIASVINRILESKEIAIGQESKVDKQQRDELVARLKYLSLVNQQNKPMAESILRVDDKIKEAAIRFGMARDLGERNAVDMVGGTHIDNQISEHIKEGLNYIVDVNPEKFANVMRALNDKGKIAEKDAEYLSQIGQSIANIKKFKQSGVNPELIDSETDIPYIGSSFQSKKAEAAGKIGEYLKSTGGSSYNASQIRRAAKAVGIDNEEIVKSLIAEESLIGYDAIPKSGGFEKLVSGIKRPIAGIIKTVDDLGRDDSDIYLRSQKLDIGDQQVPGKDGRYDKRLSSERGNIWYDMLEGAGEFLPQLFLTRGVGMGIKAGTNAVAPAIGTALRVPAPIAAGAGMSVRTADILGTAASVYMQEYANAYESALNVTGDPSKAKTMAFLNAGAAAAFETILTPGQILDNARAGLRSLSVTERGRIAEQLLDVARRGGDPVEAMAKSNGIIKSFIGNTLKIAGVETSEEVGTQIANYLTESIFSPETAKNRDLGSELVNTIKSSAIAMALPSMVGGAGTALSKNNRFTVNALHDAALNFEDTKAALEASLLYEDGSVTQQQVNDAIKIAEMHKESLNARPEQDENGNNISTENQLDYAYNNTLYNLYEEKLKNEKNPVQKESLERKMKAAEDNMRRIFSLPDQTTADENTQTQEASATQSQGAQEEISQPVELSPYTAEEQAAIDAISGRDFNNEKGKRITPFTNVIQDPQASVSDKKDALKGLYEQLTDPGTEDIVSESLGMEAGNAMYNLNYPKFESELTIPETERLVNTETSVQNKLRNLPDAMEGNVSQRAYDALDNIDFNNEQSVNEGVSNILAVVNNKAIPEDKVEQVLRDKSKLIGNENYRSKDYLEKYIALATKDFEGIENVSEYINGTTQTTTEQSVQPAITGQEQQESQAAAQPGTTGTGQVGATGTTAVSGVNEQANPTDSIRISAEKIAKYLGSVITGASSAQNSFYIPFKYNGKDYEVRVSDHAGNPKRYVEKKLSGITVIDVSPNFEQAKRDIDRKIYGKYSEIKSGTKVNHPKYGKGVVVSHDMDKKMLVVDFNGEVKQMDALSMEDKGWIDFSEKQPIPNTQEEAPIIENKNTDNNEAKTEAVPQTEAEVLNNEPPPPVNDDNDSGSVPPPGDNVPQGSKKEKKFENKPKAILNRIYQSENAPQSFKDKFSDSDLKYAPKSHEEARVMAKNIIDEFGEEDSVSMAESGRFDGDVNSMIFAEAIDRTFLAERNATTQEEKMKYAAQWADFSIRYDDLARDKGRFISAIYDFYRKSPLGVILVEKKNRDGAFKDWYSKREDGFKEVYEAIKDTDEFKNMVRDEVQSQLKDERKQAREKRRKTISDIFDKGKIKPDGINSSILPPQIWNAAVEVMKQAALAGESIANVIQQGIEYVRSNHTEAWDENAFRSEWERRLSGMDGRGAKTDADISEEKKQKLLDRFRKRLSGMSESQKQDVIVRSFKKLVDNGALNYDDFKKIVAETIGLSELTPEEVSRITGFVQDMNNVQDYADIALEQRTPESIKEFERRAKIAEKSATELAALLYNKPRIVQRVRSIIQLNTLGIVSLLKNPFYNIFHQFFVRFPRSVIYGGIDRAIHGISLLSNKVFGTTIISPDVNTFFYQKGYFSKSAQGTKDAVTQVFTGLTSRDYFQKEIYTSQIRPMEAWKDIWAYYNKEKTLTTGQYWDKVIQGSVGIPAEAVARLLNIGDKPFRFSAEAAVAEAIAAQQLKITGIDKELFLRFPKEEATRIFKQRGMSHDDAVKKAEEIEQRIISEGEQAVFQQKNLLVEALNGFGERISRLSEGKPSESVVNVAKIMATLNAPFLKTPLNLFWEIFNLANPEFAIVQSAIYGFRAAKNKSSADYVQAKKWMAHAATGYALLAMTGYLASIGAISGDDDEDKARERKGKAAYVKPKTLNISKVLRALTGKSVDDQDGDMNVDLSWYGTVGMIMNMQANKYENTTKEQRDTMSWIDDLMLRMNYTATDGLEKSVFSGTIAGINGLRQGGRWMDTWLLNMLNVGANFIQPATLAQINRASIPYQHRVSGDSFFDGLKNNFSARSALVRAFAGYPPSNVTIWGDKAVRNDGSAGGIMLNMLGFSQTDKDAFAEPIYQDFKRTGNAKFFPPDVSPKFTVDGKKIELNKEQEYHLRTLVGQSRKMLVAPFVNGMGNVDGNAYNNLSDEQKLEVLDGIYKQGREIGKQQFLSLHPELMETKEENE